MDQIGPKGTQYNEDYLLAKFTFMSRINARYSAANVININIYLYRLEDMEEKRNWILVFCCSTKRTLGRKLLRGTLLTPYP